MPSRPLALPVGARRLRPLHPTELETAARLRQHVSALASDIGARDAQHHVELCRAADFIEAELRSLAFSPVRQTYVVNGQEFHNIEAETAGDSDRCLVIGAHYDTLGGLPGANDNASGVAATLELARLIAREHRGYGLRWVFFANEEPPYFQTPEMGSYVYAQRARERKEKIVAMLSLETVGYYSEEPDSQNYPQGFPANAPTRGDFLGFVSDMLSARLLRRVLRIFRRNTSLPCHGVAVPAELLGVGWSDHWAFWQFGYRALMVTDTAPFRYPHYHTAEDTPDKLDYERMARAVTGLSAVIRDLGRRE